MFRTLSSDQAVIKDLVTAKKQNKMAEIIVDRQRDYLADVGH